MTTNTLSTSEVLAIAHELLGTDAVRLVSYGYPFTAGLMLIGGRFYILIDEQVEEGERAFSIGHELGEWIFYGRRQDPEVEQECNQVADAILAGDVAALKRIARRGSASAARAKRLVALVARAVAAHETTIAAQRGRP